MGTPTFYDWNTAEPPPERPAPPLVHDETLRDGIQNPSGVDPAIEDKLKMVHLMDELGVDSVNVGLPGAGPRAFADVMRLCREIVDSGLRIRPACAGRTVVADLKPMAEVSQKIGIPVEVMTFIGSSPIRRLVESWSIDLIRSRSTEAIDFAVREGLPVTYVTEDTTRTDPEVLRDLFGAAIDHGAHRLCLCDTVGHSTPDGVRNLVRFTRQIAGPEVGIDWHGHNDRAHALYNTMVAWEAGATRLHGCVLGIGERVGNAPLELLLVNLERMGGGRGRDLGKLPELCDLTARTTGMPMPVWREGLLRPDEAAGPELPD